MTEQDQRLCPPYHRNMLGVTGDLHPLYQTLTIGGFTEKIGLSRATVNRKMKTGELTPHIGVNGYKYFKLSEAYAYLNLQRGYVVFSLDDLDQLFYAHRRCISQTFEVDMDIPDLFGILFFKDRLNVLSKDDVNLVLHTLLDMFSLATETDSPSDFDTFLNSVRIKTDRTIEWHLTMIRSMLYNPGCTIGGVMCQYLMNSDLTLDEKVLRDLLFILMKYLMLYATTYQLMGDVYRRFVDFLSKDIQVIIATHVGVR